MHFKTIRDKSRRPAEEEGREQVSPVPASDAVVALALADIHLSHRAPLARSAEPDWYRAMGRTLEQVESLMIDELRIHCPIFCAGDVFDDGWRATRVPPELINFAIDHLPVMYAVPGQHDLPHHRYEDIRRSAYWTLVEAGKIIHLEPSKPVVLNTVASPLRLHGFPWGCPVVPPKRRRKDHPYLEVAIIHAYCCTRETAYEGAPEDSLAHNWQGRLPGFNVAVFGDNHKPFDCEVRHLNGGKPCRVFNAGSLFRRKSDERGHRPSVGLIHASGRVTRHYLDCTGDRFIEANDVLETMNGIGCETFVQELSELGTQAIDFADTLRRVMDRDKVPDGVKRVIVNVLENATH